MAKKAMKRTRPTPEARLARVVARFLVKHGDEFGVPWSGWRPNTLASHFEGLIRDALKRAARKGAK